MIYDREKVITGIVIFLFILMSPLWYNAFSGRAGFTPELVMPKGEKNCVEDRVYMRGNHMNLLEKWKHDAIRHERREYKGFDGKIYNISITGTCLGCHTDKARFCDRCHQYNGVKTPKCWNCHNVPQQSGSRV